MNYLAIPLVFGLTACVTASHSERESLIEEPVNCETAEQDIAALEDAMPSRGERVRSVVQSVTPVGAARGLLTGTYDDRLQVLSGRTEDELKARIEQIEATCTSNNTEDVSSN